MSHKCSRKRDWTNALMLRNDEYVHREGNERCCNGSAISRCSSYWHFCSCSRSLRSSRWQECLSERHSLQENRCPISANTSHPESPVLPTSSSCSYSQSPSSGSCAMPSS